MSTTFQIERGVPAPENCGVGRPGIYPWHDMEVGDSFIAPLSKRTSIAACQGRFAPKKFTARKINDAELRVWRVA